MVSIKTNYGFYINVSDSQVGCISRKHDGKLELDFNPHIIHVMNGDKKEVAYSFSEIKIEELFGQKVLRGYDYDSKKEVVVPIHQIKEFNLEGSNKGFFDKQEVSCVLKK